MRAGQLDGATASDRRRVTANAYAKLNRRDNVSTPAMLELALTAAKKAIVLLKNNRHTLPLPERVYAGKTVCMFGPNANSSKAQEAGYVNQHPRFIVTPFVGLVRELSSSSSKVKLVEGCNTTRCERLDESELKAALERGVCSVYIAVLGLTAYANPG